MALVENLRIDRLCAIMNERRARGEHIFLQQLLETEFPEFNNENQHLEKYYTEMGVDYHNIAVRQLVELAERDPLYTYLYTETILPALYAALYENIDYRQFIAYSQTDTAPVVTQPYITPHLKDTRKKGKELAPGETPETHKMEISAKFSSPETFGDIIEIDYNDIADVRLPVLNYFLGLYVLATNRSKLKRVTRCIIDGDDTTDVKSKVKVVNPVNVIGIENTTTGLTFFDILKPCVRMSRLQFHPTVIAAPETTIINISQMEEFKKPYEGKPIHSFKISGEPVIPENGVICEEVGTNNMLLTCGKAAVAEYVTQGLMLERDKVISKRVIILAWSERLHYQKLMRQAALLIDTTKAFSSYGYASYMEPAELE